MFPCVQLTAQSNTARAATENALNTRHLQLQHTHRHTVIHTHTHTDTGETQGNVRGYWGGGGDWVGGVWAPGLHHLTGGRRGSGGRLRRARRRPAVH